MYPPGARSTLPALAYIAFSALLSALLVLLLRPQSNTVTTMLCLSTTVVFLQSSAVFVAMALRTLT